MQIDKSLFSDEVIGEVERIIKKGNTVELKREKDKLVIVEIQRKVKIKKSTIGQTKKVKRDYKRYAYSLFLQKMRGNSKRKKRKLLKTENRAEGTA